jgi:hypothetical protein
MPHMVAHPGERFSPSTRHAAFTSWERRAHTLAGVPLPSPQEVEMPFSLSTFAIGSLVLFLSGVTAGFLRG